MNISNAPTPVIGSLHAQDNLFLPFCEDIVLYILKIIVMEEINSVLEDPNLHFWFIDNVTPGDVNVNLMDLLRLNQHMRDFQRYRFSLIRRSSQINQYTRRILLRSISRVDISRGACWNRRTIQPTSFWICPEKDIFMLSFGRCDFDDWAPVTGAPVSHRIRTAMLYYGQNMPMGAIPPRARKLLTLPNLQHVGVLSYSIWLWISTYRDPPGISLIPVNADLELFMIAGFSGGRADDDLASFWGPLMDKGVCFVGFGHQYSPFSVVLPGASYVVV